VSTERPGAGEIGGRIERAAASVGLAWPLHSFVTANPLGGFENRSFPEAVRAGERLFGGRGYPDADTFRRAWEAGLIDPERLSAELAEHGFDPSESPEAMLERMAASDGAGGNDGGRESAAADRVDGVLTKWLAAFLDQGQADWAMPGRERGFYAAVRRVAPHDREFPSPEPLTALPERPVEAVAALLSGEPTDRWEAIFEHQFAALPGWTGLIRQRIAAGDDWQEAHPISLAGYLAVRLALCEAFDAPVGPEEPDRPVEDDEREAPLAEPWLAAWEASYRSELVEAVVGAARDREQDDGEADDRPAAQLAFCIDTRSEVIRRHVEAAGPYETHGYAGFFGIPMRYEGYDAPLPVDACPPILDAQHRIADRPVDGPDGPKRSSHDAWTGAVRAGRELVHGLKTNAATAFSFVESAGPGYGLALAARTLLPARVYDAIAAADERVPDDHEFCEPTLEHGATDGDGDGELPLGLILEERVEYAATAFELMGIERFARLVAFVGHAGQTANNPFDSSLDCGACAGNPGGPNARVLAAICNQPAVRERLRERGHDLPADTVFVAGEHNTTTDEVTLFDGPVPESHAADLERLRADLATARAGAAAERADTMGADPSAGVRETERRAADWAETRPEWGLAGNAAFVIGPRALTADLDLDGRSFLHSYDPATDPDGTALEAIMAGPMVVTQWINSQYYFATVDNGVYGSGSKVTQNPVGNVGVYQGNGGDLAGGLPLQSVAAADDVPYHQPLRLSVVIHAPVERVTGVLEAHDSLTRLLDNGWLSLTVLDPSQGQRPFRYDGALSWTAVGDGEPLEAPLAEQQPAAED
jgi:uncharacterized protein YbcC (UPF0753/DUF2309 family)